MRAPKVSTVLLLLGAIGVGIGGSFARPASSGTPLCFGRQPTIVVVGSHGEGTAGDDVILGRNEGDVIYGRGGDDRICGRRGSDHVYGNGGSDRISLGRSTPNERGYGGLGNDRIFGNRGGDILY